MPPRHRQLTLTELEVDYLLGDRDALPRETEGDRRKRHGRERAALNRREALRCARAIARRLGQEHGRVSADDVQERLPAYGYTSEDLGNAAGKIFTGPWWTRYGYCRSRRRTNNSRVILVWQYSRERRNSE